MARSNIPQIYAKKLILSHTQHYEEQTEVDTLLWDDLQAIINMKDRGISIRNYDFHNCTSEEEQQVQEEFGNVLTELDNILQGV